jgi:hypothetical protein
MPSWPVVLNIDQDEVNREMTKEICLVPVVETERKIKSFTQEGGQVQRVRTR